MDKSFFKTRAGVIVSRAVGAAVVILFIGMITGLLKKPYWFIGVFTLTNLLMLLVDLIRGKPKKSAS
ncbi:hypothetical protein ACV1C5_09570 [Aeromonas caviae]